MSNASPNPYRVIAFVGPDTAGKTTAWRALGDAARQRDPELFPWTMEVQGRTASLYDYRGSARTLQLVDFADAATEGVLLGSSSFEGVILVVSGLDGAQPGTRDSVVRAAHLGVPVVAVALTKCDLVDDQEILDLVAMEVRELLTKHGARGDEIPVVRLPGRPHERSEQEGAPALLAAITR
jgi:translation elongation factor EF-Tu-like GTPase